MHTVLYTSACAYVSWLERIIGSWRCRCDSDGYAPNWLSNQDSEKAKKQPRKTRRLPSHIHSTYS